MTPDDRTADDQTADDQTADDQTAQRADPGSGDLNLVVLSGRLAAPPEVREFASGNRLARFLLTVRTEMPTKRVDVLPVTLWDPPDRLIGASLVPGGRLWASGALQRRFWTTGDGRRSRIEILAEQVFPGEGG